jgi:hypothetical protein
MVFIVVARLHGRKISTESGAVRPKVTHTGVFRWQPLWYDEDVKAAVVCLPDPDHTPQ